MPIGFPTNIDVTDIENIERLPEDTPPLSDIIRRLDNLVEGYEPVNHRKCVDKANAERFLRGDVNTAKCRVRDAYTRCLTKNHDISEHRADVAESEKYETNVQQVDGYLGYAIEFLSSALDRIECTDGHDRCSRLETQITDIQDTIEIHQKAAKNNIVYEGPPLKNKL